MDKVLEQTVPESRYTYAKMHTRRCRDVLYL